MRNAIHEMTGNHLDLQAEFRTKAKTLWGKSEELLDVTVIELIEQTSYEGFSGAPCSQISREDMCRISSRIGLLLGLSQSSEEFCDRIEQIKVEVFGPKRNPALYSRS